MKEAVLETLQYIQDHLLSSLVLALIAGYVAYKTIIHEKRGNIVLYFILGILGFFLGHVVTFYTGFREILDQIPDLWFVFDLVLAYVGAFMIVSLFHFLKPF